MPRNIALVIGINNYQYGLLPSLKYAKRDAEAMEAFLREQAGFNEVCLFTEDSPKVEGYTTQPTRTLIRRFLNKCFEQQNFLNFDDNFWFFFSGHGIRYENCDYIMPADGDPSDPKESAISLNWVTERITRSGAGNTVLILDACRNEGRRGKGFGNSNHKGVITIFSCLPEESSWEVSGFQHGAFTYALLDTFQAQNSANPFTIEKTERYLIQRLQQLNNKYDKPPQTPHIRCDSVSQIQKILLPQFAAEVSIAQLKQQAYKSETNDDFAQALDLWRQILGKSPQGEQDFTDAIEAIERISRKIKNKPPGANVWKHFQRCIYRYRKLLLFVGIGAGTIITTLYATLYITDIFVAKEDKFERAFPNKIVSNNNIDSSNIATTTLENILYLAMSSPKGDMEVRKLQNDSDEGFAFQDTPFRRQSLLGVDEKTIASIIFSPQNPNEVFAISMAIGRSVEVIRVPFSSDPNESRDSRYYCSLENSEIGNYHLATNNNVDKPFLVIASEPDKAPKIYTTEIALRGKGNCTPLDNWLPANQLPDSGTVDVEFKPDPEKFIFATVHRDSEVYLWEINSEDSNTVNRIGFWSSGSDTELTSISFSKDGQFLAVGSNNGKITLLRVENNNQDSEKDMIHKVGELASSSSNYHGKVMVSFSSGNDSTLFSAGETRNPETPYIVQKWCIDYPHSDTTTSSEFNNVKISQLPYQDGIITSLQSLPFEESDILLLTTKEGKNEKGKTTYSIQLEKLSDEDESCI